jgi:hypothetical protein
MGQYLFERQASISMSHEHQWAALSIFALLRDFPPQARKAEKKDDTQRKM